MTPNEYQAFTRTTATYPHAGKGHAVGVLYCKDLLAEEAGEVAKCFAKRLRKAVGNSPIADTYSFNGMTWKQRLEVCDELGDVLWATARLAQELGFSLSYVIGRNKVKLLARKAADNGSPHGKKVRGHFGKGKINAS